MSTTPVLVKPYRAITGGPQNVIADAVVEERHFDDMEVTNQPVEAGATISDHAYKLPAQLDLTYGWSLGGPQNAAMDVSFLKNIYQQLLGLQTSRTIVTVYTGKRLYQNMLVKTIAITTDKYNENAMQVRVVLVEILTATTQTVNLTPAAQQQFPDQTAPVLDNGTQSLQPAPNFNSGVATPP